jgi:hypothetical protein
MTARSKSGFNENKTLQLIFFDGEEAFETWGEKGVFIISVMLYRFALWIQASVSEMEFRNGDRREQQVDLH